MSSFTTEKRPAPEDIIACQAAAFEWTESYDTKDWTRLAGCIAPTLYLDYTSVMNKKWDDLPAADFIGLASNPHFLGNVRIRTQHFMGQTRWVETGDGAIKGHHQMRVAHQKYKDDARTEVLCKGHAHGAATVHYRRVDGVWKFAGLEPDIRWSEGEYERIFKDE